MKYCSNCGKELADNAAFCPECGAAQQAAPQQPQYQQPQYQQPAYQQAPQQAPVDSGSFGWGVLGFCFPIVGLVLFLVWKNNKPVTAKVAGLGALISVILSFVFGFIGGLMG